MTSLAMGISRTFLSDHSQATFAVLVASVVPSAWFGGRGPGLLAATLVSLAGVMSFAFVRGHAHPLVFLLWTVGAASLAMALAFGRISVSRSQRRRAMQPLPLWEEDRSFNNIMGKIQHTLVDQARCYVLYQMARQTSHLTGEVAEVGVYKGGTARLLAQSLPRKTVHLFDTFAGMPATSKDFDKHLVGDFADTSLSAVQNHLKDCGNTRFYEGLFPMTAGPIEEATFSLVHVDADIYDSVRACCHFFYPRLESGGVLLFDDYGFPSCPGARKAVDEFFSDKPEIPFYSPTGQCWVVRK